MDYSRSDILRLLAQAMRAQPEPEPNTLAGRATINLPTQQPPNLPNIGGTDASSPLERLLRQYQQYPLNDSVAIERGRLSYRDQLGPANVDASVGVNGDWRVNGQMPIGNAMAKMFAESKDGNPGYGVNAIIPMLKGILELEAQRQGDDNRYGVKFRKTF